MVEYSLGYKEKAEERLRQLEDSLTPQARVVARELSADFEKSSTKQVPAVPQAAVGG